MVSALLSGASSLGLSPSRGHCVVFLADTLLSQCLSPPRYKHPIKGGVETFSVASCYRNRDKLALLARMQTLPYLIKMYMQGLKISNEHVSFKIPILNPHQ